MGMKRVEGIFRECSNPTCQLRFPSFEDIDSHGGKCPGCGDETHIVEKIPILPESEPAPYTVPGNHVVIPVLDNLRSIYNVGSIFRTANGFGIQKIILGGITPTPNHQQFYKTSLGAERTVSWEHSNNTRNAAIQLKNCGYKILCLENLENSTPLNAVEEEFFTGKIALVVGNENCGIDPAILRICNVAAAIPMLGSKKSHNVCVAFGIALYHIFMIVSKSHHRVEN